MADSMTDPNPLVSSTVCLLLRFRRPGIKRRLTDEQFTAQDAERELVAAQKKILDSPEYQAVGAFESHIKTYLRTKALPSKLYRDSTYLIPLSAMKAVDEFLEKAKPEYAEKVDACVSAYPARKAETMKRLGQVAAEGDYLTPEQLRAAFEMAYEYVALSTPSSLKRISAAMFEREEQRLRERLSSAEGQIIAAFREQFGEMVEGKKAMVDGSTRPDGKQQRFAGWRIEKLQKFIDQFTGESNVCGDDELKKLMAQTSQMLAGVDPKELKDDAKWRAQMSEGFSVILKEVGGLTKVRGKRVIQDADEDQAPAAGGEQATA